MTKPMTLKRQRYQHSTTAERWAYYHLWQQSGLSKAAFCRRQGLVYITFHTWCRSIETQGHPSGKGHEIPFHFMPVSRWDEAMSTGGNDAT